MSDDVVIRIEGLWKSYELPVPAGVRKGLGWLRKVQNPKSKIQNPKSDNGPWALRDINLEIRKGETLGIIGRNGAGKSTLLKLLAGVTPPTRGKVEVHGRVFPMIELNAGIHRELTGRENVFLLGAVMGLTRTEAAAKMVEIAHFCELGEWFDRPVRKYSSGMLARLGFAVAMNVDADVLLVDEVLSVGDLPFQRRCYDKLGELRMTGVTVVFVSHALRQVERLCDRTLLLYRGEAEKIGETGEVVNYYYNQSTAIASERNIVSPAMSCISSGEVSICSIDILDDRNRSIETLQVGDSLTIRITYESYQTLEQPIISISILTADFMLVTNFSTDDEGSRPDWDGRGTIDCHIRDPRLLPGIYYLRIIVRRSDGFKCFKAERAKVFRIVSDNYDIRRSNFGIFHTPVSWRFNSGT